MSSISTALAALGRRRTTTASLARRVITVLQRMRCHVNMSMGEQMP